MDARSEPILAIVIVAGMAGILLTPTWGTLLDTESLDRMVLAVVTFIGGLLYGAAGYFLLGVSCGSGSTPSASTRAGRKARQLLGFAALPFALSILNTGARDRGGVRLRLVQDGGSDDGTGRDVVLAIGLAFALWSLGLLALGLRMTLQLPWRGVIGALRWSS